MPTDLDDNVRFQRQLQLNACLLKHSVIVGRRFRNFLVELVKATVARLQHVSDILPMLAFLLLPEENMPWLLIDDAIDIIQHCLQDGYAPVKFVECLRHGLYVDDKPTHV